MEQTEQVGEYEGFPIKKGEKPMFYTPKEGCHICHKRVNTCILFRHQELSGGSVLNFQPSQETLSRPIILACFCCAKERESSELKNYVLPSYLVGNE